MDLSKKEIAAQQIERAIDLYIDSHDYVCAITLAGAAEEILGKILMASGGQSIIELLYEEFSQEYDSPSLFYKDMNFVRNELKHAGDISSLDGGIDVGEDDCSLMLARAIFVYMKACNELTDKMAICWQQIYGPPSLQ